MKIKLLLVGIAISLLPLMHGTALTLRSGHPNQYVVKEGDTLWSIANQFLEKPWEWRELWYGNPHIKNPNHIFPGDVIELTGKAKPTLRFVRGGTVRLSPNKRVHPVREAIPPVPIQFIKPFLNGSLVLNSDELQNAPYVLSFSASHLAGGNNTHIFVSDIVGRPKENFSVYRDNGVYLDPYTKEILGYVALHVGEARLVKSGAPATLLLTDVNQPVNVGDRLLPKAKDHFTRDFYPQAPQVRIDAEIISMFNGLSQTGSNAVVVINRGRVDGMRCGDVLAIEEPGETIPDPVNPGLKVTLPNERTGQLMIFRTFDRVSFGLVMVAIRPVNLHDFVTNPA